MNEILRSSELDALPRKERYFALTFAYIDAAINLCKAFSSGDLQNTFANACPLLWLSRQATELFYKSCLFAVKGAIPCPPANLNMHNLVFFRHAFLQQLPEHDFPFDPPVMEILFGDKWTDDEVDQFLRTANTAHQRHRYPADSRGNDFCDVQSVSPETMCEKLLHARQQMETIEQRLNELRK